MRTTFALWRCRPSDVSNILPEHRIDIFIFRTTKRRGRTFAHLRGRTVCGPSAKVMLYLTTIVSSWCCWIRMADLLVATTMLTTIVVEMKEKVGRCVPYMALDTSSLRNHSLFLRNAIYVWTRYGWTFFGGICTEAYCMPRMFLFVPSLRLYLSSRE